MNKVTIYTDGSCVKNPGGAGGWAAIIIGTTVNLELSGAVPTTTNNRMELMAAAKGLEALTEPTIVTLYSDSKYLVDAFEQNWVEKWQSNGWKNSAKQPVKNRDLWEQLIDLCNTHTVIFEWVKGHVGIPGNERADILAGQMAWEMANSQ